MSDQGEVQKVVCGKHSRDSVLDLPVDQVKPFYRAMQAFDTILSHPRNCIRYKMKEGELCVDEGKLCILAWVPSGK